MHRALGGDGAALNLTEECTDSECPVSEEMGKSHELNAQLIVDKNYTFLMARIIQKNSKTLGN